MYDVCIKREERAYEIRGFDEENTEHESEHKTAEAAEPGQESPKGAGMRVDFSFNQNLVEAKGYTMTDIYETVKREFAARNIPCASEGEIISFVGGEQKNDFSNMWAVIMQLLNSEWFMEFATSCIWREDNDKWEDVLRQAREKH